jgi:glycosyltransferase involved in cell wall biosynthesis
MINILFLQTQLIVDGPGVVIKNIINYLDATIFTPFVGCLYQGGKLEDWYKSNGIQTINFNMKSPFKGWLDIFTAKRITDFLKNEHIDLIHTHLVRADIYGRIASKLAGIPVITTIHNMEEHHTSKKVLNSCVRYIDKKTMSLNDVIVAVSDGVKCHICSAYNIPPANIYVIHNGIECPKSVAPLNKETWGVANGELVICTVARLHKQKGIEKLIRVTQRLNHKGYKLKLMVVGDGPLRQSMSSLIQKLKVNAVITGFQDSIYPFMQIADIFVLPSLWEGFGLSIIEAMALSKPVVASNVGGIPEVVVDGITGILTDPKNEASLEEAILKLLKDAALREKMGVSGNMRVREYFTAEIMSRKYQRLYKTILPI